MVFLRIGNADFGENLMKTAEEEELEAAAMVVVGKIDGRKLGQAMQEWQSTMAGGFPGRRNRISARVFLL